MYSASKYTEFDSLKHAGRFRTDAFQTVRSVLARFFRCSVSIEATAKNYADRRYGIDILENTKRGCYPIEDDEVLLVARVLDEGHLLSAFGIRLYGRDFSNLTNLLNSVERATTSAVSRAWLHGFEYAPIGFGNELCEKIITNHCAQGRYDYRTFRMLVSEFHKLAGSTFEGKSFGTGAILTRALHQYLTDADQTHGRVGEAIQLENQRRLGFTPTFDRRFWYLVNGRTSYFLINHEQIVTHLYFPSSSSSPIEEYFSSRTLDNIIKGGDVLFRVVSENEFTITNSDGLEFIFQDGHWRLRDFSQLRNLFIDAVGLPSEVASSLLALSLELSSIRESLLIVIPNSIDDINDNFLTYNKIGEGPLGIDKHRGTVKRMATSDGALVIDKEGMIIYFGCIIETQPSGDGGIRGTGETAAETLGEKSLSIKISQDGTIKAMSSSFGKIVV